MLTALILSYVQNGRNNFQHCWDTKYMVERIKQIRLCKLQGDHV